MNLKNNLKIDLVIKNGSVVLPDYNIDKIDIGIHEGKICEVGSVDQSLADEVIDANGLMVMPGAIDTQVHFENQALHIKKIYIMALKEQS